MSAELRLTGVHAAYVPAQPILRGINITARPGQVTVVLGPNGAGKSTMLRAAAGYLTPSEGTISLGDVDITRLPAFSHPELGIAFLPQGRSTFPDLTVAENVELGGWIFRSDKARLRQQMDKVFARYPTLAPLRDRPAGSLSGGQQRAIEIARLLMTDPSILLIDEPSVGLAPNIASQVYSELAVFRQEGRTVLLVDQDVRSAIGIADYVYVLTSGKNDAEGDRSSFEGDLGTMVRRWLGV
jgi:branched-chain amino acid transport system ATP-binding protein